MDNIVFSDNTESCVASPTLQAGDSGAIFRYRVNNAAGAINTDGATITVQSPSSGPFVTTTTLVSRALAGGPPNNMSNQPSISADGRYVAFTSVGTNLSEDSAIGGNAYVRDMQTGITKLINYGYDGDASSAGVYNVKLSSNGRYAIFSSRASDLVPGDTNDNVDIFRRDLLTGTNLRLSVMPNGDQLEGGAGGNGDYQLDISADGQAVIFLCGYDITGNSSNNGYYHLYHRYVQSGFTADVAGSSEYQVAYSALSKDGDHVAFAMGVSSGTQSIQIYDAEASSYSTVFSFFIPPYPAGLRQGMSISRYGRYVAFSILAPDLLGSPRSQVIVADRNLQTYVVASTNLGVVGDGHSAYPEISDDGRYVAFSTLAPSLTNNLATGSRPYLVVRDLVEENTSIASLRADGTEAWTDTGLNDQHALSEDGTTVAFVGDYNVVSTGQFGYQVFAVARP
jgi:Tol biopolymer transport system component